MPPILTPRGLVALAAAGSTAVLIAALIFQALGFPPCDLCVLQRWPHLVAAILGALILLFRLPMAFAGFGALASLATAIIAPGDVVLAPNPSYPIHTFGFIIAGATIRSVPATPDDST